MCKLCDAAGKTLADTTIHDKPSLGGFSAGDFLVALPGAYLKYKQINDGDILYVSDILNSFMFGSMLVVLWLNDGNKAPLQSFFVKPEHFRKATPEELAHRRTHILSEKERLQKVQFKIGDPIVLLKDIKVQMHTNGGSGSLTIRKGQSGIVDYVPFQTESEADSSSEQVSQTRKVEQYILGDGSKLFDYISPRLRIYFPEAETFDDVPFSYMKRRPTEFTSVKLVVPDGHMEKLQNVIQRVINKDTHDHVYEGLGLSKVCQKGRGAIILFHGPPGTGKTLTAEILGERTGKAVIKLNLSALQDGMTLMDRLMDGFQKAQRYNAILLLDEVDVFVKKRGQIGGHPVFDENTSVFLRILEYYDGILLMTTNLVDQIDPAVFSRVHLALGYDIAGKEERKEIWASMLPPELRKAIVGDEDRLDEMLNGLADLNLNGREIKTVIQNAVSRAVVEHTRGKENMKLPEVKWIRTGFFLEEAKALVERRDMLSGKHGLL